MNHPGSRPFAPIQFQHLSRTCCPRDVSASACANNAKFSFCISYLQMTINFMFALYKVILCSMTPFTFCKKKQTSLLRTAIFHPPSGCFLCARSALSAGNAFAVKSASGVGNAFGARRHWPLRQTNACEKKTHTHTHTTWLPVGASGSCFVSTVSSSKKNTSWSIDLTRFQNNSSLHLQIKEADFIMFLLDLNWREDLCIVIFVIFVGTSCDCDSFLGAVLAPCSWHHPHDNLPILQCSLQLKRRPLRELSGNQGSESMLCQVPNMYDGCIVLV